MKLSVLIFFSFLFFSRLGNAEFRNCQNFNVDLLLKTFAKFVSSTLSESSICFFRKNKCVILLESWAKANKIRMISRNTNSDGYRGRMLMYPILQNLGYFLCAKLFHWPIYFTNYSIVDDKGNHIFGHQYESMQQSFESILAHLDLSKSCGKVLKKNRRPKPYNQDMSRAVLYGIYR